ncbi:NAD(P)-dependent dehydrogenase (short-subunit alcohol dehydrogenase family) [Amaricoccus macauensis]|uniref:NAD(P)-dependent dehydrogenase (Short-subunit alcohol dehydrogenase family) n=1 Tax=Amaricoccus macauensis TaxID=57001 RepID=A0A840SVV9_9RHOB|nr:SDR family oxidoreductase [Amaricoccus macauensis]MBB5223262.1 NAD(P)-dependent dehydrogenase (short-subunit alcohol dehydrogenase family) [Amaricoccus macauensis]
MLDTLASRHVETRAIITGGAQGLGLAIALRLVAEGCPRLVLAGRDEVKGAGAVDLLAAAGAEASFVCADLSRVEDCFRLVDTAAAEMGGANALVNAAATCDRGGLLDTTPEIWARLMDTNARGPFFTMQRFAEQAIARQEPAAIVNILSMVIHCGQPFLAPYTASKAALAALTKNLAQAHRRDRIRVNGIACGWMDTEGEDATQRRYHGAGDDWLEKAEAEQPFGQLIKPAEVAGLASYLLAAEAGVMTGSIIDYDQNIAGAYF